MFLFIEKTIETGKRGGNISMMNESSVADHITRTFPGVEAATNFGYTFFFYGSDHTSGCDHAASPLCAAEFHLCIIAE